MAKKKDSSVTGEVLDFEEEKKRLKEELDREAELNDLDLSIFSDTEKLDEMNAKHAFINSVGGKPMVLCHTYSVVANRKIIEFRSPESIMMQYSNQTMSIGNSIIPLGNWWIRNADRKEYETVIFDPEKGQEYKNCLNLWEGLTVEPIKGCWKITLKHLYKILCNRDRDKFKYVIKWFAWSIQNPGTRAEVAVIFKGKQGAGKGFIFTQFVQIFGQHGLHISNRKHLTGDFNGHMQICSFLFADEAYYPGDKEVEGAINQLISEPLLAIEAKRQNVTIAKNCLHIGMATNAEWVIPATGDTRRYFINEVDNTYAKNQCPDAVRNDYFHALWGEMNEGGREAMVYDMKKMDLNGWHPRADIPDTEEFVKQVSISLDRFKQSILEFIDAGEFPGEKVDIEYFKVNAKVLIDFYENLSPANKKIQPKRRSDLFKLIGAEKKRSSDGNFYVFPSLKTVKFNYIQNINRHQKFDNLEDEWIVTKHSY